MLQDSLWKLSFQGHITHNMLVLYKKNTHTLSTSSTNPWYKSVLTENKQPSASCFWPPCSVCECVWSDFRSVWARHCYLRYSRRLPLYLVPALATAEPFTLLYLFRTGSMPAISVPRKSGTLCTHTRLSQSQFLAQSLRWASFHHFPFIHPKAWPESQGSQVFFWGGGLPADTCICCSEFCCSAGLIFHLLWCLGPDFILKVINFLRRYLKRSVWFNNNSANRDFNLYQVIYPFY